MDEHKSVSEFTNVSDNHDWILANDQIKTNQKTISSKIQENY